MHAGPMRVFLRVLKALAAGALLSLASLALSDREWIHASEWDPAIPLHESTHVPVTVWGRPLAFVRDSPVEGTVGSMDRADTLRPGCLAVDWVLFTGASAAVAAIFRRARAGRRERGSVPQRQSARKEGP